MATYSLVRTFMGHGKENPSCRCAEKESLLKEDFRSRIEKFYTKHNPALVEIPGNINGICEKHFGEPEVGFNAVLSCKYRSDLSEFPANPEYIKMECPVQGHTKLVTALAFAANDTLASASYDGSIIIRSTATGDIKHTLETDIKGLHCIDISKDGKFLAAGGMEGPPRAEFLRVWELAEGDTWVPAHHICDMNIHFKNRSIIQGVGFSSDSCSLAACTDDMNFSSFNDNADGCSSINLYDLKTGNCTGKFSNHKKMVNDVAMSGDLLVSVSKDMSVQYRDLGIKVMETPNLNKVAHVMEGHEGDVKPDCNVEGHTGQVWSVLFTEDGQFVVTASAEIIVCDRKGKLVRSMARLPNEEIEHAAIYGEIIAAYRSNAIQLWNVQTGEAVGSPIDSGSVKSLAFSPDGKLAVASATNNSIQVWASD